LWSTVPDDFADRSTEETVGDIRCADHTPVHEYRYKLSRLKERLFTQTARNIAADRHEYMATFFARLELEVHGEL
jgi:hypothetical protein